MLFTWGPPQPSFETGIGIGLEDNNLIDNTGKTVADHNQEVKAKELLYSCMSQLGLLLIAIGFGFQFVAIWVDRPKINTPIHNRPTDNQETGDCPKGVLKIRNTNDDNPE